MFIVSAYLDKESHAYPGMTLTFARSNNFCVSRASGDVIDALADTSRASSWTQSDRRAGEVPLDWELVGGTGFEAQLHRAIYGDSQETFERALVERPVSSFLTSHDVEDVYHALAFANRQRWVLNMHLSVTWESVGITEDARVSLATTTLMSNLAQLSSSFGVPLPWIAVLERGKKRGLHAHVLFRCSEAYQQSLKTWLWQAVEQISGNRPLIGTNSETVFLQPGADADFAKQWRTYQYVMKGIDPNAPMKAASGKVFLAHLFAIEPKDQGQIAVPRVLMSRLIDRAARKAEGFISLLEEGNTSYEQLFSGIYLTEHLSRSGPFGQFVGADLGAEGSIPGLNAAGFFSTEQWRRRRLDFDEAVDLRSLSI